MSRHRSKAIALALLSAALILPAWALTATWLHLAKLERPSGTMEFAKSVALGSNRALVGASQAVDVFEPPPPNTPLPPHLWLHVQRLLPQPGAMGSFGYSVAIDGERLAVGAPFSDLQIVNTGYVDIYERTSSSWVFRQKVVATFHDPILPGEAGLSFGMRVALLGDALIVGVPAFNDDRGRVFAFERNGGLFYQTQQIKPAEDRLNTLFGDAIALSANTLAIGRSGNGQPVTTPGEVHLYARVNGAWALQQVLVAPNAAPHDRFGLALDMRGDRLVVRGDNAVYLFMRTGGVWFSQWQYPLPTGLPAGVALRPSSSRDVADDLFVGLPSASVGRVERAGKVLWFTRAEQGTGFVLHSELLDPSPAGDGHFGMALSGLGDRLLISAPADVHVQARARVFAR